MMDVCGSRNAEHFEEMKVSQFKWILKEASCGLPSLLKEASKYLAIHGIILSILFMVLGAGGTVIWVIAGLGSLTTLAYWIGAAFLVVAILLFIYNLILLSSVRDNNGVRVFKIIKIGCLILLYLQLITMLGLVILLADRGSDPTPAGIGFLALGIFLTSLAIYGIHCDKPKIVSWYIYFMFFVFVIATILFMICSVLLFFVALCVVDLGGFFAAFHCALTIYLQSIFLQSQSRAQSIVPALIVLIMISFLFVVILVAFITVYYLAIFALHVNMMNIAPVKNNLHHHEMLLDF